MARRTIVAAVAILCADVLFAQPMLADDRVEKARKNRGDLVRKRVQEAGLAYPPGEIFLRVFKREAELEVWARDKEEPFRKVVTFAIAFSSGLPGPKRREGDRQVPEGFYVINVFNPQSKYHLSLGLNYPNASDRVFADAQQPGSDIYIHGRTVSVGCLPIGDEAIEELYLLALDTRKRGQREIAVHLFPARMSGPEWIEFARAKILAQPELQAFWESLQPGYEAFEREKRLPRITVERDGRYRVAL